MKNKTDYKEIFAFSWDACKTQIHMAPWLLLGMGAAAFLDTLFPLVMGMMVREINQTLSGMQGWSTTLALIFAAFVSIEVAYHTIRNTTIYFYSKFALRTLFKIVTEAFSRVQKFSTEWHANAFAGGTVRKITRGMWAFDVFEDILFMFLYPTAIVMVSTIVIMFLHWPIMGWVTMLCVTMYVGFSVWAVLKINAPKFKRAAEADTKVGAALADAITGNAAVKAFGKEYSEERRFDEIARHWQDLTTKSWQSSNWVDLGRRYMATFMLCTMVGTSVWLWSKGQATSADVVYVLTAYMVLSAYLRNIGEQISNLLKSMSEMEDVVSFWRRKDDIKDKDDAQILTAKNGEVAFDKVRFAYTGKDQPIYDDFSVQIKSGEKVALVGQSGSGKSTFVKLIQRLYDVNGGVIKIDGQDIRGVTQESLRRAIALVPQEPILFHRSISSNIAYGKPSATMDEIIAAAKKAFAHDFIESLPQGYETLVGERGIKLSGGERQRVAIARAVLADAPILILDEATSSLDSISEHYIQKALEGLMDGRTTITIAHRLATIKAVDRILVFDRGRIVEQGTHNQLLMQQGSYYKQLYDMQALDLIGENTSLAAE